MGWVSNYRGFCERLSGSLGSKEASAMSLFERGKGLLGGCLSEGAVRVIQLELG